MPRAAPRLPPPNCFRTPATTVWLFLPLSSKTSTGYAPRPKQLKNDPEMVLKALREKFAALVDTPEKLWCDHRLCDVAGHDIAVVTSLGI